MNRRHIHFLICDLQCHFIVSFLGELDVLYFSLKSANLELLSLYLLLIGLKLLGVISHLILDIIELAHESIDLRG